MDPIPSITTHMPHCHLIKLSVKYDVKIHFISCRCANAIQRTVLFSFEYHDDVIEWKHFPRYWPFVRGIHRSPVNSPHKGQGRGTLMFSLICAWINDWVNNLEACDLRHQRAHYDVIVMSLHDLDSTRYIHTTRSLLQMNHCSERHLPFSVGERENL